MFLNIIRSIGSIQASAKTAAAGIKSETDKIGNALQGAFGVDATKASSMMQKFLEMRGVERAVTQLKRMQREYGLTSAEAIEFAKSINASDEVLRRFADTQERTKQGGRGVSGLLTPYSLTSGVQAAAGAVGVSFGMYGMVELTKSVFNATTALDSLQLSFKQALGIINGLSVFLRRICRIPEKAPRLIHFQCKRSFGMTRWNRK